MNSFVILPIMPVMAGTSSLFSTLTGGHTAGGFLLGVLVVLGILAIIRNLAVLCFSGLIMKSEFVNLIFLNLQEITDMEWSKQRGSIFICGQFQGQYRKREAVFQVVDQHVSCPGAMEAYLLLKPNITQTENLLVPAMFFYFFLKRNSKFTKNTYTKRGWLVYKPKLSYGDSAWDFYKNKQHLIQALDELTQAAEIVEAKYFEEKNKSGERTK
ncbi:MAG: hypothetical protein P9M02_01365 [Candidatus Susulua stagnicola]|nr:hypothetical protein [Candidatus Susulua stagnicola]